MFKMKINNFLFTFIFFNLLTNINSQCVDFENGQLGGWKHNGKVSSLTIVQETNSKRLKAVDDQGYSIIYNDVDYKGDWIQKYPSKCLSFSLKQDYPANFNVANDAFPIVMLYQGTNPSNGNNYHTQPTIIAHFIPTFNISDNTWASFYAPISLATTNGLLPSNDYGRWWISKKPSTMSNSNAWNQLIRNVSGIIYKTDIGWNNQVLGEILIDDLCFANCQINNGTVTCNNNYISNPGFENGMTGWTSIGNSYTLYNASQALQPDWVPQPSSGKHCAIWVSNHLVNNNSTYNGNFRSILLNQLNNSILPNSGKYKLTFDYACLNTCGKDGGNPSTFPEISIYGLVGANNPTSITGSHSPSNSNIFGTSRTFLMQTTSINNSCGKELNLRWMNQLYRNQRGKKYKLEFIFDSNIFNQNISHLMLTHSDQVIANGRVFISVDNFCLVKI